MNLFLNEDYLKFINSNNILKRIRYYTIIIYVI